MDRSQELNGARSVTDTGEAATITSLRRAGIARDGQPVTLTPLSGGVSCDVWLARIGDEAPVVVKRALPQLRVTAEWLAPVERAENEVRWLRYVGRIDARLVPEVVAEVPDEHLFALAYLEPERVVAIARKAGLEAFTTKTLSTLPALSGDLAEIRRRGWSVDDEERNEGMRCVAAAIFNDFGEPVGGVSVSGPTVRVTPERLGEIGPRVAAAADEITAMIGGKHP